MSSRAIKTGKIAAWVGLILVVLFIAGEVTVRIMGYKAYAPVVKETAVFPGGSLFQPHDSLGYRPRTGSYSVVLDSNTEFSAIHDANGMRLGHQPAGDTLPEIWFMGCSFTYGWGVNTGQCWPEVVKASLDSIECKNFAAPGYGTLHSLLQLRQALRSGKKPNMVVVGYGAFHNQRNVCSRHWKKALDGQRVMSKVQYPYLEPAGELQWKIAYSDLVYTPWVGSRHFALLHFLEIRNNLQEEEQLHAFEATRELFLQIHSLCRQNNIRLVVAGIFREEGTISMLNTLRDSGMEIVDISVESTPENCIAKNDLHPNAAAHRKMADSFLAWLHSQRAQ